MANQKIIIIGSGPIGLSCAYYALKNGDEVSIFHKSSFCAGLAAGGMLAPAYEFLGKENYEFTEFAFKSRKLWDELALQLSLEITSKCLVLANNDETKKRLNILKVEAQKYGFNFDFNDIPDEFYAQQAINISCDALINPVLAIALLKDKILQMGGNFIEIADLNIKNNKIIANTFEYNADKIIIAAGVGAKKFSQIIPSFENIYGVRGQIIEFDARAKFKGSVRCGSTYLISRGDKTIVGATAHPNDEGWDINQTDIENLRQNAIKICPDLENAKILNSYCGVRPASKDGLPIIGKIEGTNVSSACAPFRNGWLLAPAIAKMALDGRDYSQYSKAFSPKRYK